MTAPAGHWDSVRSLGIHVFRLGAFFSGGHFEADPLTFGQRSPSRARNSAEVDEYVGTTFSFDEAKTLCIVKPFDGARDALS